MSEVVEAKKAQDFELTDAQKTAVYTIDDNVAVSAGAGSGKTQVLSMRFLHILEKLGLESYLAAELDDPLAAKAQNIMAITFTKKAATEMRERIRKAIGKKIAEAEKAVEDGQDKEKNIKVARFWRLQLKSLEKAHIDTLHSLCSKILRENPVDAGIDPQFRVAEDVEGKVFVQEAIADFVRKGLRAEDEHVTKLASIYGYGNLCESLYSVYGKIEDILADERVPKVYAESVGTDVNGRESAMQLKEALNALIDVKDNITKEKSKGREKLDALNTALPQILDGLSCETPNYCECRTYFSRLSVSGDEGKSLVNTCKVLMDQMDDAISNTAAIDQMKDWLEVLKNVLQAVSVAKQKHNIMTFDDLETMAVALMRKNPVIRKKYADKFTHIMVDEFQDTNERQRQLIYMLCGGSPTELKGKKLFIVGDSKQSIYRFRGAEVQVFAEVCQDIKDNGVYDPMEDNFRSLDYILDVVNGTFKEMMKNCEARGMVFEPLKAHRLHDCQEDVSEENKLLLDPKKPEFMQIKWPKGQDGKRKAEAIAIVKKMQEVNGEFQAKKGNDKSYYGEMAILLRTMTAAKDIIDTLQEQGIPYEMENKNFYELQEVLDIINLFKALMSKDNDIELAGILRSPYFGLDDTTITQLFLADKGKALWDNLFVLDVELAAEQKQLAEHAQRALSELQEAFMNLGPIEVWEKLWQKLHPDYVLSCQSRGDIKLANVNILRNSCAEYCRSKGASLAQWLEHVAELRENGGEEKGLLPTNDEAVKIYSIHKSKGLEYPVVFVSQLDRKENVDTSSVRYKPKFGFGVRNQRPDGSLVDTGVLSELKDANKELEQDERVRQMYVAMTRAKERLYLTGIVEESDPTPKNPTGLSFDGWMGKFNNIYSQANNNFIEMVEVEGEAEYNSVVDEKDTEAKASLTIADEYISPLQSYQVGAQRTFSPSSLQTYLHCQRQYFYQYVMGLPPLGEEEEAADGADALNVEQQDSHEAADAEGALAAIADAQAAEPTELQAPALYSDLQFLNAQLSAKDLGSIIHRALELYKGDLDAALEQAIKENAPFYTGDGARKMLEGYLVSALYQRIPKGRQLREQAFTLYTPNGFVISGIIDCLGFNSDGSMLIVDYKTGRPPQYGETKEGYAYQLAIYEKVVRERWARAKNGEAPKVAAELHFLRNNTAWSLPEGDKDYYAKALALCEEISRKSEESEYICKVQMNASKEQTQTETTQKPILTEENAKITAQGLAHCDHCPYNYVCNHK